MQRQGHHWSVLVARDHVRYLLGCYRLALITFCIELRKTLYRFLVQPTYNPGRDTSSLRNRLFLSIVPSILGTINVWVAGSVAEAIITNSTWRIGIGMFCILTPVLALPILTSLSWGTRVAKREGTVSPSYLRTAR